MIIKMSRVLNYQIRNNFFNDYNNDSNNSTIDLMYFMYFY